jgi:radical SAM superfamily enzyme YgiQ (UPF0313 family)
MSIEAGDPKVREEILSRNMTNEEIIRAHDICEKYNISTFTNCIVALPGTTREQDIESIDLSIKAKVTWAEFPIFFPFPATVLGDKTLKLGYYDGDYMSMHTSYQSESPLNCFSKKDKNFQKNIGLLGPVCVVYPYWRNIIVKYMLNWPYNFFFIILYYTAKMKVLQTKIYPTKKSIWQFLRILTKSLKQEFFRHYNKKG